MIVRTSLIISLLCLSFSFLGLRNSKAADYVPTGEIMRQIEKTLLFDDKAKEEIDFYRSQQDKIKKDKSDINIEAGSAKKKTSGKSKVEIVVFEPKTDGFDIKEKEKLAYNASLIGQHEVAIELYKQILKSEPNNNYTKFCLAVAYQKIGQYQQAQPLYYQLLKSEDYNKEEVIGNLLAIMIESSPRESSYFISNLTLQNPKSAYILAQASIAYERIGDLEKAQNLLERAIHLDGDRIDYKYNLAIIYDKSSDYEKALSVYNEIVRSCKDFNDACPSSIKIDEVSKRIESIKNKIS